jgi:hypothetical protein
VRIQGRIEFGYVGPKDSAIACPCLCLKGMKRVSWVPWRDCAGLLSIANGSAFADGTAREMGRDYRPVRDDRLAQRKIVKGIRYTERPSEP